MESLSGVILLSVVKTRTGDVESVRKVLSGDNITVASDTTEAIGSDLQGPCLQWSHCRHRFPLSCFAIPKETFRGLIERWTLEELTAKFKEQLIELNRRRTPEGPNREDLVCQAYLLTTASKP